MPSSGLTAALWPPPSLAVQRPHSEVNKKLAEAHPGRSSYVLDGGLAIGVDYGETGRRRLRTRLPYSLVSMQGMSLAEPVLLLLHPLLFWRPRLNVHPWLGTVRVGAAVRTDGDNYAARANRVG